MTVSIISNGCFIKPATGGSGGFLGLGIWRYRTAITSTPASGELQFDDTTVADATELYVHSVNDSGADMSAFLDLLSALDLIYIQVQVDASQFVTLQIGTPSLAASVYTFPISQIQAQGATPSDDTEVAVVIERDGVGAGVTDHGALTGLADYDHNWALHKDITGNITVGYTTDVEPDGFANPLVPDLTLEYFKTMTVTGGFTLDVPTGGNGHCEYYLTIDSGGPYTLVAGANVTMMDANVTMEADGKYVLNIHKYSDTVVLAQLLLSGDTSGAKWNAYGDDATGGGPYSVDGDLNITPAASSLQVAGVDVLNRESVNQFTVGPNNTNVDGNSEVNANIQIGSHLTALTPAQGQRESVNVGLSNYVGWRGDVGLGRDLNISALVGNGSTGAVGAGINVETDSGGHGVGKNIVALGGLGIGTDIVVPAGMAYGKDVSTGGGSANDVVVGSGGSYANGTGGGVALALGNNCTADGVNIVSMGIGISNTVNSTMKMGFNDLTAVVIANIGLGIGGIQSPQARLHVGAADNINPAIIMEVPNAVITTPVKGALEYGGLQIQGAIDSYAVAATARFITEAAHGMQLGATVSVQFSNGVGETTNFTPAISTSSAVYYEAIVDTTTSFTIAALECISAEAASAFTISYTTGDNYLWFTQQDAERSAIVAIRSVSLDHTDSPYQVTTADSHIKIDMSGSSSAFELNLPPAGSAVDRMLNVKLQKINGNPANDDVNINPFNNGTIIDTIEDGSGTGGSVLTILSSQEGFSYQLVCDGSEWGWV